MEHDAFQESQKASYKPQRKLEFELILEDEFKKVNSFDNNMKKSDTYINGGFFVINKDCIKKIKDKSIYWEKEPLSYFLKIKNNGLLT